MGEGESWTDTEKDSLTLECWSQGTLGLHFGSLSLPGNNHWEVLGVDMMGSMSIGPRPAHCRSPRNRRSLPL